MTNLSKHIIDVLEGIRDGHMIAKISEDIIGLENELDVAPGVPPSHDPKKKEKVVAEKLPKENDLYLLQPDTHQSKKRESNLLKIIGGFVQTVYLQRDTGKFWKGEKHDQPNISAIAEAFQGELIKAGYSDEGFKERNLRDIITSSLEQIKEN
ncbi:hypothetical protein KKHLCK_04925 [Candidatus Electrothrix laxa]